MGLLTFFLIYSALQMHAKSSFDDYVSALSLQYSHVTIILSGFSAVVVQLEIPTLVCAKVERAMRIIVELKKN